MWGDLLSAAHSMPTKCLCHYEVQRCLVHSYNYKLRGKKPTPVSLSIIIISDSLIYMFHRSYGESEAKEGEVVCYGQPVALVTLPDEGGQVKSCVSSITLLSRSPPPPSSPSCFSLVCTVIEPHSPNTRGSLESRRFYSRKTSATTLLGIYTI